MFTYIWEREVEHKQGRGRGRGTHRIWSRLQAPSCPHRARHGGLELRNREIMTWAKVRCLTEPPWRPMVLGFLEVLRTYATEILFLLLWVFYVSFETSDPRCFLKKPPVKRWKLKWRITKKIMLENHLSSPLWDTEFRSWKKNQQHLPLLKLEPKSQLTPQSRRTRSWRRKLRN